MSSVGCYEVFHVKHPIQGPTGDRIANESASIKSAQLVLLSSFCGHWFA